MLQYTGSCLLSSTNMLVRRAHELTPSSVLDRVSLPTWPIKQQKQRLTAAMLCLHAQRTRKINSVSQTVLWLLTFGRVCRTQLKTEAKGNPPNDNHLQILLNRSQIPPPPSYCVSRLNPLQVTKSVLKQVAARRAKPIDPKTRSSLPGNQGEWIG
jgi:hypothetical protein